MAQTPETVLKDLKANKYAPIYFLQGDEPFYIDQISNHIEQHALVEHEKGFNQIVIYGRDADIAGVLSNARRFPMMSERQVVIVKEAQELADLGKEDGKKLLETYINKPLPSTILVFCHKYGTVDGRSSLCKSLDKLAILVTTKKLYDNQLPDWIDKYVGTKGFTIDVRASQLMADYIGNDLERLSNEIDKILINFKEKVTIDTTIIQKFVGISKEYNVFELQKALTVRDIVKANAIINYFASNQKNNPIIPIIAAVFSFYSKLLLLHHSENKTEKHLASALGVNPFFVKEYLIAAKNYPLQKVVENIHAIRLADLQSKGIDSNLSEEEILKELVFKLLH